jgi:hypothetical protein
MANYESRMRTSYFQVKDKNAFIKEIEDVESLDVQIDTGEKGVVMFGSDFAYGDIPKFDENEDYIGEEQVSVFEIIRTHLKEGEAVLVNSIGYENMRYLHGTSFIITPKEIIEFSAEDAVKIEAINRGALSKDQVTKLDCTY